MSAPHDDELLRGAFCEMHGTRLHGFALLVTLGDRSRAAQLSGEALHEGALQVHELRHPERAAAWLRARVLQSLRRRSLRRPARLTAAARLASLRAMGVDEQVLRALWALSLTDRGALVASTVERLEPADVQTVLGRGPSAALRATVTARRRYLEAHAAAARLADERAAGSGPLTERVLLVAARALARSGEPR